MPRNISILIIFKHYAWLWVEQKFVSMTQITICFETGSEQQHILNSQLPNTDRWQCSIKFAPS